MQNKSFITQDVRRLNLKENPAQLALLEQAYDEIYLPAFPVAEERDTLDHLKECLMCDDNSSREYVFVAAGNNLDNPEQATVNALGIGIYYKKAQSGLMAYNAVRKGVRGLGRVMVDERIKAFDQVAKRDNTTLRGIFLEVNNPGKITAQEDVIDPHKRIDIFKSWGAEIVPIDYTQPPLDPKAPKCDDLLLMNYATPNGRRPSVKDTIDFLREMYAAYGDVKPENDLDFQRMRRQLLAPIFNRHVTDLKSCDVRPETPTGLFRHPPRYKQSLSH